MHPIEHLYYFSCVAPALYFYCSPFHFLFNGVHLLLSPAASAPGVKIRAFSRGAFPFARPRSHSGWEDHAQSDQFHYLHHRRFECNYGSASLPLDALFGTFRDVMFGETPTYAGAGGGAGGDIGAADAAGDGTAAPAVALELTRKDPPGFRIYLIHTAVVFAVAALAVSRRGGPGNRAAAAFVAFSPLFVAREAPRGNLHLEPSDSPRAGTASRSRRATASTRDGRSTRTPRSRGPSTFSPAFSSPSYPSITRSWPSPTTPRNGPTPRSGETRPASHLGQRPPFVETPPWGVGGDGGSYLAPPPRSRLKDVPKSVGRAGASPPPLRSSDGRAAAAAPRVRRAEA